MKKRSLQIQQLNTKMQAYAELTGVVSPPTGWVRALRVALGMSMEQLGKKLGITKQSVLSVEKRERDGSITLKALSEVAAALDMKLVYGFAPKDGSLEAMIERKARERAREIVLRASHTMRLEEQENSVNRISNAIEEKTFLFKNELPKILWD
jgi:predicted DNA-binding mobile mystery protein A